MPATDPMTPETRRFSIRLPRPVLVGLRVQFLCLALATLPWTGWLALSADADDRAPSVAKEEANEFVPHDWVVTAERRPPRKKGASYEKLHNSQ